MQLWRSTMSKKNHRSGDKYSGSHTTVIPAAGIICDVAYKCDAVTRIALGYIKAGLKSASGQRRVKMVDEGTAILLSIRDNTSHQEVRVYASGSKQEALETIARGVRNNNMHLSFTKD